MVPGKESHLRGSILYFFLFMAHGSVSPFLPLIWRSKGLSEHEVGFLWAIRPVVSVITAPAVCALADRRGKQKQVLYVLLALYAIARPSVLVAGSVLALAAQETFASISQTPIGTLVDSAVRQSFGASGYGKQRMWGALGYGVASLIAGFVFDAGSGGYGGVMVVFVTVTVVALVTAVGVSTGSIEAAGCQETKGKTEEAHDADSGYGVTRELENGQEEEENGGNGNACGNGYGITQELENDEEEESGGNSDACGNYNDNIADTAATATTTVTARDSYRRADGGSPSDEEQCPEGVDTNDGTNSDQGAEVPLVDKEEEGQDLLSAVWALLSTTRTASFFMAVVLSGMGAGVIDTFLFIRLQELGGSNKLFGLARLVMCLAEVPFFYVSGPLIERIGVRSVVALAQVAYIVRFLYYSVLQEPWWVLPAELLHGLTFAAMWAAAVSHAQEIAPVGAKTTVLGLISGLYRGMGLGLGAIFGGYLYTGLGARLCFRVCSALPFISLLLLAIPTAQRWLGCGGNRWREGTGEIGLEGWGDDDDSHKVDPELTVNDRKGRDGKGEVSNGVAG